MDVLSRFNLNQTEGEKRGYVYEQNPNVQVFRKIGNKGFWLQLAINTNQFGRTFQDRYADVNVFDISEIDFSLKLYHFLKTSNFTSLDL